MKIDRTDLVFSIGYWELRIGLAAAVKAAGDEITEEKRDKVTFHTLRHTAASLMVAAGVPLYDVAKILGHSTLAVTMRYAHFAPEAGRRAIAALSDALSGRTPETATTRVEAGG